MRDVSTEGSVWSRLLDTRVTDESVIAFSFEKYDRTLATFPGYDHFLSAYYTLHTCELITRRRGPGESDEGGGDSAAVR